jgi:hypothetical protein
MDNSIHSVVAAGLIQDRIATATAARRVSEIRRARRRRPQVAARALELARAAVERSSVAPLQ